MKLRIALAAMLAAVALAGCGAKPGHTPQSSTGPNPALPAPETSLIPSAHFPRAVPWPDGQTPNAPEGFHVTLFAGGLHHPRWLYVLPDGDVLVAEASTEPRAPRSLQDRVAAFLERNSGEVGKSADRIPLLRDSKGNGHADVHTVFLTGVHQNFGMALIGNQFYVAGTGGVWVFPYQTGQTHITAPGRKIADLPVGGYNNHWTRNLFANADGSKLFVTVGSGSNAGEHGAANEFHRANVLEMNPDGSGLQVVASGMRNPNGLAYEPAAGALWTVVNERDFLGNDLVPDYMTRVRPGAFYGWPYSYWGKHLDPRVKPQRRDLVARALTPDYALGAHVAPLGLVFYTADMFPAHYHGGAFVAEHGSWNRSRYVGYRVVYVPFRNGLPIGAPEDFLTGFMPADSSNTVHGRPAGLALDKSGALLVADDTGNAVWRVSVSGH